MEVLVAVASACIWGELSAWVETLNRGFDVGKFIVVAIEALQGGKILESIFYPACGHVQLDGPGEFAPLLHNIYRCLSCSHEFAIAANV